MDKAVWLVDFTESAQGPIDLLQSNITGIIDHYRLGGLVTQLPPEVWIRPVGSSATLLSDTVNLRASTTTKDGIRSAAELSVLSGVNRKTFARDLLIAKTDLRGLSAQQLLDKDLKASVVAGTDVRIAQIEVICPDQPPPHGRSARRYDVFCPAVWRRARGAYADRHPERLFHPVLHRAGEHKRVPVLGPGHAQQKKTASAVA